MLIGIDASRSSSIHRTGTENYSYHLIRELLALRSPHVLRLYFRDEPPLGLCERCGAEAECSVMPFPRLWTHARLSWEMRQNPPDLLFVPSHVLPVVHPRRCVATVHDLGYHYHPEAHTLSQNLHLRWSTRHNARAAARIMADSEATRADLIRFYRLPSSKIEVVYPGIDEGLRPVSDAGLLADVSERYGIAGPYLLYVGTLHPRKNLVRLVEAFALAAGDLPASLQLVLAGQKGWLYEDILSVIRRHALSDRVRLTGYVPDSDLPALLTGAMAFVFPSLYEGFGFPVLEAMACGTPVVCSSSSSLPEVAGDAALFVDPLSVNALAEGLVQIVQDGVLRARLVERGFRQVNCFSWRRCAEETLGILEEVAGALG
ncbi:glycosyltransferase family 4 protein [Chloroflexota bacterium]